MQPGTVPGGAGGFVLSARGHAPVWVGVFRLSVIVNGPEGEGVCLNPEAVGNDTAAEAPTMVGAAMPTPEIAARTGGPRQRSPTIHVRHSRREVRHLVGT